MLLECSQALSEKVDEAIEVLREHKVLIGRNAVPKGVVVISR